MIEPGQTYERAGVIAVVIRKRDAPPEEWGFMPVGAAKKLAGDWYDVYNITSDTSLPFHEPGTIVAWHESLFEEKRCKRIG